MTIFLDYNSTTNLDLRVLNSMIEIYKKPYNNSAIHHLGVEAESLINKASLSLKNLVNGHNYQVIFTSGATESCNQVLMNNSFDQLFYSSIEHACIYNCRPHNQKITEFNCLENGLINLEDLAKKLFNQKNFLNCAMLANNETGAIQNIKEIAKITHQNLGLVFCDIVQGVGKIAVDLEDLNVDFACISAHKIYGPQGIGALLVRKGLEINPLIYGGKQQFGKRAGTMSIASIVGFGHACELASQRLNEFTKIADLRNYLEKSLKEIANDNLKIISEDVLRLANTSLIALRNVDSQTQLINFDLHQICVSAGSACSSKTPNQSRIAKALGLESDFLNSTIRISLGFQTTKSDIDKFINVWNNFYQKKFNKEYDY
jgi:cysteine desulfurase